MGREIKFRGQRLNTREWVCGDLIKHSKIDPFTYIAIGIGYHVNNPEIGYSIRIYPETVGQYTGLKDRNGKEIYEGDRIKENDMTGKVKWNGCGFMIEWEADCYSDLLGWENYKRGVLSDGSSYEVVGNLFESPELIK